MAVKRTPAAKAPAGGAAAATKQAPPSAPTTTSTNEQPVTEVVEVTTPVQDGAAVADDNVDTKFQTLQQQLVVIGNAVKTLTQTLKVLQKNYAKAIKTTAKRGRKAPATKRSPSGFAKPAQLSDELCDFLKIPRNSERARTEVTRMINDYIKQKNLQDPSDKRNIRADDSLRKIMNLKDNDVLSYFNLQKYIKHHFVRTA